MLAACLAFRNAAPYLREWLLFHAAVGVKRFYLYDNDSTDNFRAVLAPFLVSNPTLHVELIPWPGYFQQNAIYDDCLKRATAAGDVQWLAFIDDDEFLYATSGQPLPDLLRAFESYASVAVCWHLYGSSGNLYADDTWVVSRFTRRAASPDQHVKCIVQPARIARAIAGGHLFEPKPGFACVDEHQRPLDAALTPTPSTDVVRVNHYLIKSIEEMIARRTSRDIGYGDKAKLPLLEWIRLDRAWNVTEDASAHAMVSQMRQLATAFPTT
jgi:hypothetical protein